MAEAFTNEELEDGSIWIDIESFVECSCCSPKKKNSNMWDVYQRFLATIAADHKRIEELEEERDKTEGLIHVNEKLNLRILDHTAEIDRLWGVLQKGLTYGIAIQEHAKQKKSWVQSDKLDRLYNEWITAIRQVLGEGKE